MDLYLVSFEKQNIQKKNKVEKRKKDYEKTI